MATPKYLGAGQPPADGEAGLFGRIGAFFNAPSIPAYAVAPVVPAAPAVPAAVGASAPSVSASAATTPTNGASLTVAPGCPFGDPTGTSARSCACACHVEQGCAVDPSLAGRIAIIVPHGFPYPGA